MATNKVIFVRHGESEWNKLNLFCGWYDANLSDRGEWDASMISAKAIIEEKLKFDVVFTSALKRSRRTAEIILNALDCPKTPIYSSWRLNERHYGALTGFNKRQLADVYGEEQVQIWRRSYDIPPPPITPENPYYHSIRSNSLFKNIPENEFPDTESLATTMDRVVPFWKNEIVPEIKRGKKVLIAAHGTSLRGIVKYIENMEVEKIRKFNLPNSIPFVYEFDTKTMEIIGGIKFFADDETVSKAVEKVASLGK